MGRGAGGPDRLERWMGAWYGFLGQHRMGLTVVLALGAIFSSVASRGVHWEADILSLFSGDSVASLRGAAAEGLGNQMRLSVSLEAQAADVGALREAVDVLGKRLGDTGAFVHVWTGASDGQLISAGGQIAAQTPLLLSEEDLGTLQHRMTAQYIQGRLAGVTGRLADPDGEMQANQFRADPLDARGLVAARLKTLSPAEEATMEGGLLLAADRQHAMIVLEPKALPADTAGAAAMMEALQQAIDQTRRERPALAVAVVGPHRNYTDNAQRVQRDVAWISALGTLAVAAAIGLYFRSPRAVAVCLIPPVVGVGIALGLFGMAGATLPLIVLAFGGMLCGSTTDYGIQLIAACRRQSAAEAGEAAGPAWPRLAARAAREMLGPISMSVATSVTGFAALGLSASPGLRALGFFVAGATACVWGVTFLVLPAYLGVVRPQAQRAWAIPTWLRWAGTAAFIAATLVLLRHAGALRFNADPKILDGSSAAARADEAAFYQTWGDLSRRAVVIVRQPAADDALRLARNITDFLSDEQADGMIAGVISPSALLPDAASLQSAAERWKAFWTADRQAQLQGVLGDAAAKNHLNASWVAGAADQAAQLPLILASVERIGSSPAALVPGLVRSSPEGTTLAIIVELKRDASLRMATAWIDELRLRFPVALVLSGHALFLDATDRARAEAESFAPWVVLAILLPLWLYFRRITLAWITALSLLAGFIWVLGAAEAFAGGLTLLSLVPLLFTLGVTIDYGIYAASDPAQGAASGAMRSGATMLCALTTILGVGALAMASHPVLHWLGLTLIAGVTGGYLASYFVVGPLVRRWRRSRAKAHGRQWQACTFVGRVAFVGLLLAIGIPPLGEYVMARQRPAEVRTPAVHQLAQLDRYSWTYGDAWMRKRNGIWEISAGGMPEDIGAAVALLGGPLDVRIEHEMLDQLDTLLPQEWARWLVLRGAAINLLNLPAYTPVDLQREIYASAQARPDPYRYLSPTYPRILGYHALHDVSQMLIDNPLISPPAGACTGIVALPVRTRDGHLLLARNFDFEGGESFGRQKSISYIYPSEGIPFATVAWPGLVGCVTGMNQQHIALFINAAPSAAPLSPGFRRIGEPTIFVARDILQHARSIDEAVAIFRKAEVFVSDILVIADGKSGQAVIVERTPGMMAVRRIDEAAAVTNHFLSPELAAEPLNQQRMRDGTTVQRLDRAAELLGTLKKDVTPGGLAGILRDKRGAGGADIGLGNRNAIDGLIACHSVVMDVTAGKLWVAQWPNAQGAMEPFDVSAMLAAPGPRGREIRTDGELPADVIMSDGTYAKLLQSRAELANAENLLARGDAVGTAAAARRGIALNPLFFQGHALLGAALLKTGDHPAAKVELSRALSLQPPYRKTRAEIEGLVEQCK